MFKKNEGEYCVGSVTLRLSLIPQPILEYGPIQESLHAHQITTPTQSDIARTIETIRWSKLPKPSELGNAGSFFQNPIIPKAHYLELLKQFPHIVSYPVDNETVKIPAGWLIEHAGARGLRKKNIGTHEKQALVIVNYGGASGEDIIAFSEHLAALVSEKFGITLSREVQIR
jgi:UDP-N-acetylmuramate dehydrogenase